MKTLLKIGVLFALALASSLVVAWAGHNLWTWFVADSLGAGPGFKGWWGIFGIFHLALMAGTATIARDPKNGMNEVVGRAVGVMMSAFITVVFAWLYGKAFGWL